MSIATPTAATAVVQLPGHDDRLLSVFRIQSYTGHWAALSETSGRSWGTLFPTGTWAVSPNLLALNNGAVVLTSGRPGIGLWLASFAGHHGVGHDGLPSWVFHNVIAEHNQRMPSRHCSTRARTQRCRMSRRTTSRIIISSTRRTHTGRPQPCTRRPRPTRGCLPWIIRRCCCRTIGWRPGGLGRRAGSAMRTTSSRCASRSRKRCSVTRILDSINIDRSDRSSNSSCVQTSVCHTVVIILKTYMKNSLLVYSCERLSVAPSQSLAHTLGLPPSRLEKRRIHTLERQIPVHQLPAQVPVLVRHFKQHPHPCPLTELAQA